MSKKYGAMYYGKNNSVGIRRKWGSKSQCFSFGGVHCPLDETSLRGFADQVMKKLDEGEKEKSVKLWVDDAVA